MSISVCPQIYDMLGSFELLSLVSEPSLRYPRYHWFESLITR